MSAWLKLRVSVGWWGLSVFWGSDRRITYGATARLQLWGISTAHKYPPINGLNEKHNNSNLSHSYCTFALAKHFLSTFLINSKASGLYFSSSLPPSIFGVLYEGCDTESKSTSIKYIPKNTFRSQIKRCPCITPTAERHMWGISIANNVAEGVEQRIRVIESPYCDRNNCSHTGSRPSGAFCCLLVRTKYIFCILNGIPLKHIHARSWQRKRINSFLRRPWGVSKMSTCSMHAIYWLGCKIYQAQAGVWEHLRQHRFLAVFFPVFPFLSIHISNKSDQLALIHTDRVITLLAKQQGIISKYINSEPELCHSDHLFLWKHHWS